MLLTHTLHAKRQQRCLGSLRRNEFCINRKIRACAKRQWNWLIFIMYSLSECITNHQKQETYTIYRAHVHQRVVEINCYLEAFHRKYTKQPEMTSWFTSYEKFNFNKHWKRNSVWIIYMSAINHLKPDPRINPFTRRNGRCAILKNNGLILS